MQAFVNPLTLALARGLRRLAAYLAGPEARAGDTTADDQQRVRIGMDAAGLGLWDWNIADGSVYYSPGWLAQAGYAPDELPGTIATWERLLHPTVREAVIAASDAHLASGRDAYELEFPLSTRSGAPLQVLSRGRIVARDAAGRPTRAIGVHVDVTEMRAAREELRLRVAADEMVLRFARLLLDSDIDIDDAIDRVLAELGEFRDVDCAGYMRYVDGEGFVIEHEWRRDSSADVGRWIRPDADGLLPWRMREVLAGRNVAISSLDELPPEATADRAFLASRDVSGYFVAPRFFRQHLTGCTYILTMGRPRHWEDIDLRLLRTLNELMALAVYRRVMDANLARAYAETQHSKAQLQAVIDHAPTTFYMKDTDGRVLMANEQWCRLFGHARDDVIGRPMQDLLPAALIAPAADDDCELLARGRPLTVERRVPGSERIHLLYKFPLVGADGVIYATCGIGTDITHLKRIEEELREARDAAEAATRAKGEFLATMSHEIRTPMNGVIGTIELLRNTALDDHQRHLARVVRDSALSLLAILNDVLDFSKIESGKLEVERVPLSLRDVVEGAADTLGAEARAKQVRLIVDLAPDLPARVNGDPLRLRQILLNLLGNAIKFSSGIDGRGGRVLLRACPLVSTADGARVQFEVSDNGIGMDAGTVERLFEPFTQAESATTRRYGGSGLGLSICRRLVELMGGTIAVRSRPGAGASFMVELPFPTLVAADDPTAREELRDVRVLVALDDRDESTIVSRHLAHLGARVDSTGVDGALAAASAAIATGTPHAVVIGVIGADGRSVADALRARTTGGHRYVLLSHAPSAQRGRSADTLCIEHDPLRWSTLIRAVAVAAGRARGESLAGDIVDGDDDVAEDNGAWRILAAEDHPTNRLVIREQLAMLGYPCDVVADGAAALRELDKRRYAVLLTDCHMPEMDGYTLARRIRAGEGGGPTRLPIIAITANALEGEIDRCRAAGMDDYLSKPVEAADLRRVLRRWTRAAGSAGPARERGLAVADAIDPRVLDPVFGADQTRRRALLDDFVAEAGHIAMALEQARTARDANAVVFAAHKLKSAARTVGAVPLADLCAALERAGRDSDWPTITTRSAHLPEAIEAVTAAVAAG